MSNSAVTVVICHAGDQFLYACHSPRNCQREVLAAAAVLGEYCLRRLNAIEFEITQLVFFARAFGAGSQMGAENFFLHILQLAVYQHSQLFVGEVIWFCRNGGAEIGSQRRQLCIGSGGSARTAGIARGKMVVKQEQVLGRCHAAGILLKFHIGGMIGHFCFSSQAATPKMRGLCCCQLRWAG